MLVGLTLSTVLIARERDAAEVSARREATAAEEADRQRQIVEENLRQSRKAVDRLFTQTAEELRDVPHMEQIRRKLLEGALEFYQGFLHQKSDDPAIRLDTASAYRRVGETNQSLGRTDEAIEAFRNATRLLEDLQNDFQANESYREAVAASQFNLGSTLHESGKYEEAKPLYQQALAGWQSLAKDYPTKPVYRRHIANWYVWPCTYLTYQQRRFKEAEQRARRGLEELDRLEADFPDAPKDAGIRAHAYSDLAQALLMSGNRDAEAEEYLRKELATAETRARQNGQEGPSIGNSVYYFLTVVALRQNRSADAESLCRQRLEHWQNLISQKPDIIGYRVAALKTMGHLMDALTQMGRFEEVLDIAQRRDAIGRGAVASHPKHLKVREEAAWANYDLASALFVTGQRQQAADHYRQALAWLEQLASDYPDVAKRQHHFAQVLLACPAKPFRDPEKSQTMAQRALQLSPENAALWSVLGGAQTAVGDHTEAIESFSTAKRLYGSELPADDRLRLALAYWKSGDHERGRDLYDQVAAELPDNPYAFPRDIEMNVLFAEVAEAMGITEDKDAEQPEKAPATEPSPDTQNTPASEQEDAEAPSDQFKRPAPNDESETESEN
ncbi:MAG: tetratricopeptide repeat protein [Pirellulales bacterium]